MKKNIGAVDRIIRLVVAAFLAILIITGALKGTLAVVMGVIAVIFAVTAFVSFCGLYSFLGISSKGKGRKGGSPRVDA